MTINPELQTPHAEIQSANKVRVVGYGAARVEMRPLEMGTVVAVSKVGPFDLCSFHKKAFGGTSLIRNNPLP